MIVIGVGKYLLYGASPSHEEQAVISMHPLTWFLILRAFSSGCTALTGVEAVSDGVPAFRDPSASNASITLTWMGAILGTLFLGVTLLAHLYGVLPREGETVASQLARTVFGGGVFYYLVQAATAMILILAANTSYADFPRLSSFLARDGFLPRQLGSLGDRLVFSNGIIVLGVLASLLIILFQGQTHALIPLYAVGVFLSFTLSQAAMVRRWKTHRWWRGMFINGIGAIATGIVLLIITSTKFIHGAWIVVGLLPLFVVGFQTVAKHYRLIRQQLSLQDVKLMPPITHHIVIVPISGVHKAVVRALQYAKVISPTVIAVYVTLDPQAATRIQEGWEEWGQEVPLIILDSPHRSILEPLLHYIDRVQGQGHYDMITILLPGFVPAKWWQFLLHNQTSFLIRGALLFRKGTIVIDVPFHLDE